MDNIRKNSIKAGVGSYGWDTLSFVAGSLSAAAIAAINRRFRDNGEGVLIYRNNRAYNSVLAYALRRQAVQALYEQINKIPSAMVRKAEKKAREALTKQLKDRREQLIKEGKASTKGYGEITIKTESGAHTVKAIDRYNNHIPEALILSFDTDYIVNHLTFKANVQYFIDLAPEVSVHSGKNLVFTKVQGRDFTRKELISGDDITFSVRGNIVSDGPGVYPENEVKKFIQIMQHSGVVKVNHFLFGQFNVSQIIIKDFRLEMPQCKNEQPYSFTCVAVEPDEAVIVTTDTIQNLNSEIKASEISGWYKFMLENKLAKYVSGAVVGATSAAVSTGLTYAGTPIDDLMGDI